MADTSKTSFGLDQVNNETPPFANWIFRGYFIISKAMIGWIAAVGLFPTKTQFVVVTTVSLLLDPIVLGFSKLFGIVPVPVDPSHPFVASQQVDDKGNVQQINPVVLKPQEVVNAPDGEKPA
jgi:hypothetical protein